jgi:hypothetical protein
MLCRRPVHSEKIAANIAFGPGRRESLDTDLREIKTTAWEI